MGRRVGISIVRQIVTLTVRSSGGLRPPELEEGRMATPAFLVFLMTRSDESLVDHLEFGAGPAGLPTPVLERGAAVRVSRFMLPLNQMFSAEINLKFLVL